MYANRLDGFVLSYLNDLYDNLPTFAYGVRRVALSDPRDAPSLTM